MMIGPPSGVTEEEWAEHIHEEAESVKTHLRNWVFAAVDLMLMPSEETYAEVREIAILSSPDFFKACNEIPCDYSEEHAEYLLAYLMEVALTKYWMRILRIDDWYRAENRDWLEDEVIGTALAFCKDDEKAKVAEYLDQLKKVNLYGIYTR